MTQRFEQKVALVTGGNSGIGRATAMAFGKEGARVVVTARRTTEGNETVETIKRNGGEASFVQADVTNALQVDELITKVVETYGRLDIAFNNAGVMGAGTRLHEYTSWQWEEVVATNLTGVWSCMRGEIKQMLQQRNGTIVNNSSTSGVVGGYMSAAYAASKHGVIGLTKSAALEYAGEGIRVNAVCPGWVRTAMTEDEFGEQRLRKGQTSSFGPLDRMADPAEIASAVLWLCSDESSFVTGQSLVVDGGLIAG